MPLCRLSWFWRTVLRNQCGRLSRVVTLTKVSLGRGKCRWEQLKRRAHRAGRCAHYHSVKNVQVLGCKRLSLIQENAGDEHLLRLNCAKTERKHPDPTAIQDSAVASQTLNLALKKEELCKRAVYRHQPRHQPQEDLPWLTQQDFRALAEHVCAFEGGEARTTRRKRRES